MPTREPAAVANVRTTCRRLADYVAIRAAGQAALALATAAALAAVGLWWRSAGNDSDSGVVHEPQVHAAGIGPQTAPRAAAPVDPQGLVIDINQADAAELDRLPRIGPTLAQRIVDDRNANGPFESVDDLDRVNGIGKKTVEQLRPYARVK